jgi:hypothetical protein
VRRASTPGRVGAKRTAISEKEFQAQILQLARLAGWKAYHTFDSRRSTAGFPDLVLVRPPVVLFVELKSEEGKLRPEQKAWLEVLSRCERVEARLWRPGMWPEIERVLCRRGRGGT